MTARSGTSVRHSTRAEAVFSTGSADQPRCKPQHPKPKRSPRRCGPNSTPRRTSSPPTSTGPSPAALSASTAMSMSPSCSIRILQTHSGASAWTSPPASRRGQGDRYRSSSSIRAPCDLAHRVRRDGQLLIDRAPRRRIAWAVKSRNEYFDMEPIRRLYRHGPSSWTAAEFAAKKLAELQEERAWT